MIEEKSEHHNSARPIIPLSVPVSSLVIRAPDSQLKVFTEER